MHISASLTYISICCYFMHCKVTINKYNHPPMLGLTSPVRIMFAYGAMESTGISLAMYLVFLHILAGWLGEEQLSIFIKESS